MGVGVEVLDVTERDVTERDLTVPGRHHPSWFRRLYGAGLAHAFVMTCGFLFAGYMLTRLLGASHAGWLIVWFVGAIVLHDLVLLPLYSALDRVLTSRRHADEGGPAGPPWVNYVRVPAVISGTLLLITFPLVFRLSERAYASASGLNESVYLMRWLLITLGMFAVSLLLYLVHHARVRDRAGDR
jgi:hypothetical protein